MDEKKKEGEEDEEDAEVGTRYSLLYTEEWTPPREFKRTRNGREVATNARMREYVR